LHIEGQSPKLLPYAVPHPPLVVKISFNFFPGDSPLFSFSFLAVLSDSFLLLEG